VELIRFFHGAIQLFALNKLWR